MWIRKLFIWIFVLVLASVSCQSASILASPTPPQPTATPAPPPTDTAVPAEPTATPLPPPTATPTPRTDSAPVIQSVDLRPQVSNTEMTVYQDVSFQDLDGDAYFLNYELVSSTVEDIEIHDSAIKTPPKEQQRGAIVTGTWNCGSNNYEVELRVIIADKKGNKSKPSTYTIVCGLGDVPGGFPDAFDDNRNGWYLGDRFLIQDGELRNISSSENVSSWLTCNTCAVTPEQNILSVEAWWSNSNNNSLGLVIDDGTCMTDTLSFMIGPHGYYSVLQVVRDESGEWRHWRPLIDWVQSGKIHTSRNQPNLLTAEYEFLGEDLHIKFSVNGAYITRVEVYSYNGSKQCVAGLRTELGLEAHFDNFTISALDN